jgi:hypothetical protein
MNFEWCFNRNIDAVRFPNSLHTLTFGYRFNQNIKNVIFHEIYYHSQKITFKSCKWPKSLHKIIHVKYKVNIVIYERVLGKFTKCAIRNI